MRPSSLDPLYKSVSSLSGIGPKLEQSLGKLLLDAASTRVAQLRDLIFHLPYVYIDRRNQPGIAEAPTGAIVTLKVQIERHKAAPRHIRAPHKVYAFDDTGDIELTFFHGNGDWLARSMPMGETRYISGKIERFNGRAQMVHPDHIVDEKGFAQLPKVEAIYPAGQGVAQRTLQKAVWGSLAAIPPLPEWQEANWLQRQNYPKLREALIVVHKPDQLQTLNLENAAFSRLAYDELLAGQLALGLTRAQMRRSAGIARQFHGVNRQKIEAALPFSLTQSQHDALEDIETDLRSPERMLRLLQGDVGAGKTVVALMAMAHAAEAGLQSTLMAPTEILVRQHYETLRKMAEPAGLTVVCLTGKDPAAQRRETLARIKSGDVDIIVGTHALFQSSAEFANLGVVIVDEQHRFGVHQRLALTNKGAAVDILVMTATPIPRTLVLTYFGDMDVSKLTEKPAGRLPIKTSAAALERLDDVLAGVHRQLQDGRRIYWVCPLVEESEMVEATSAEDRANHLRQVFGDKVGLVHGRMTGDEKNAVMTQFKSGEIGILVATTVIEVGVDVPEASVMIIEHAERFGLSQLHQLRGRVGRGAAQSSCLLLYKSPLGETSRARISIMRETEDGFRIAEEDLRLRGEGEVLGTRQSGTPGYQIAQMEIHGDLLQAARDDAKMILDQDPDLTSQRGEALRTLLYLFGKDEAIQLLRAG